MRRRRTLRHRVRSRTRLMCILCVELSLRDLNELVPRQRAESDRNAIPHIYIYIYYSVIVNACSGSFRVRGSLVGLAQRRPQTAQSSLDDFIKCDQADCFVSTQEFIPKAVREIAIQASAC